MSDVGSRLCTMKYKIFYIVKNYLLDFGYPKDLPQQPVANIENSLCLQILSITIHRTRIPFMSI